MELNYDNSKLVILKVAKDSIQCGLDYGEPPILSLEDYPVELAEDVATFVTIKIGGDLRGCIGTLEAHQPLIHDVNKNAFASAFRDSRFGRLTKEEFIKISLSISILSTPESTPVKSEKDLISKIRPGIDGLIIKDGYHQATFLPSVWNELSDPEEFLLHLKHKAGMTDDYWSDDMECLTYQSIHLEE